MFHLRNVIQNRTKNTAITEREVKLFVQERVIICLIIFTEVRR